MNSETKVKQCPILFSTPMVQAMLEGRKTVTRRIVKLRDGHLAEDDDISFDEMNKAILVMDYSRTFPQWKELECPYGNVGDILWVRESFSKTPDFGYVYKASQTPTGEEYRQEFIKAGEKWAKWKPSIHMPFDACRIFLQITDIKVERLQDIPLSDVKKEGCTNSMIEPNILTFKSLWESINGGESWALNPFVWVVSFHKTDRPNP